MPTLQEKLLASIDPEVSIEPYARRADEAINTFLPGPTRITRWDEYKRYVVKFLHHAEVRVLKLSHPCSVDPDFDWGRCSQFLQHAYGPSGTLAAFELVSTAKEGGVYAVLKAFAKAMADEVADRHIEVKVNQYWNSLTVPEQHAACDEYLRNYGHLLPSELTEGHATRVRVNFPTKVLREHPRMLQRLRRLGRE